MPQGSCELNVPKRALKRSDGMVSVTSIDTGKVLDVIFLSNSCSVCKQKK